MSSTIQDRIVTVLTQIAPDVDPAQLEPDVELRDQIDFDSMDTLNFAAGLKREFGIDVPDADIHELGSLARCVKYVQSHLPVAPAGNQ